MPKTKTEYVCQNCGFKQVGWSGRCSNCDTWGSLVETIIESSNKSKSSNFSSESSKPENLTKIKASILSKTKTNISELDRVLGGGLVPGQVILLAGEPGIGKSTILLQVCQSFSPGITIYASGEESNIQIKIRADRLKISGDNIDLVQSTDIDQIVNSIKSHEPKNMPKLIVIDSIQTMATSDLSGLAGSVGQIRECTYRLVRLAKSLSIPIVIVGHVTKEGSVAGPALLAHLVDTVLWFEGDKNLNLRLIRAYKNRFGATDEVGIFQMNDTGLVSVSDPTSIFISEVSDKVAGTAKGVVMQGSRPVIVEIQSSIVPSKLPTPRHVSQGVDTKKIELILAVLFRRCGINLSDFDVFINVVGGLSTKDPGIDLAIAMALASSKLDIPILKDNLFIGEVGLLGETRPVFAQENRTKEAKRLGYKKIYTSKSDNFLSNIIKKVIHK